MALSQTPVKFYRGLNTAYTASIDTWKDGIFFSMDDHVIYHNGIKFGGIDPKYFEGTTKNFDINGSTVTFQKLDKNGAWKDITIKLVEAADNSIVISDLVNDDNVTDGFTVKVNVKNVGNDVDGLKLDNNEQDGGLYVDFNKTNAAIKANKDAIGVLNGADTVEGSVAKSIKDAIDGLDVTAIGENGKVIATVSQKNGKVSATTIDLTAANVGATASSSSTTAVAVTGTTVAAQISSLATSIKSVSGDAKSYSIASITGDSLTALGSNVHEAYALVDEDGTQAGEVIKIYKDSSLSGVALVDQELQFTYILADGSQSTVGVDVSKFLAESEFSDGLQVVDHVVSVKRDSASESFLTVGADGVKLSGVQAAIDSAAAQAHTEVNAKADGHVIVAVAKDGTHDVVTVTEKDIASAALLGTAADNKDAATAFGKIANEVADRKAAVQAQKDALDAEIAARKAVDGVAGDGYTAKADANYISKASSLFDADVKLDAAIKTVADNAAKAHTKVNIKDGGHVTVAVENDGTHDVVTVSEDDIASEKALNTETTARAEQDDKIEAAVGLNADGNHVATSGNYTSKATTVVGEIAALDAALKQVADTLLWIDCGSYKA